jgi:hypothetical protein
MKGGKVWQEMLMLVVTDILKAASIARKMAGKQERQARHSGIASFAVQIPGSKPDVRPESRQEKQCLTAVGWISSNKGDNYA